MRRDNPGPSRPPRRRVRGWRGIPAKLRLGLCALAVAAVVFGIVRLVNAVREGSVTHFGQDALDESVRGATKRQIGAYGGYGFGGIDPEPVESAAYALYALKQTKRNPTRRMRLL